MENNSFPSYCNLKLIYWNKATFKCSIHKFRRNKENTYYNLACKHSYNYQRLGNMLVFHADFDEGYICTGASHMYLEIITAYFIVIIRPTENMSWY